MASGKVRLAGLLVGVIVLAVGCAQWPKNGFLDPSQVGRFSGPSTAQPIANVVSIKDEPLDIEAARDPGQQDLEPVAKDYLIGPGDTISVTIYELLAEGTESAFPRQVSETGYISLPELGAVKVGGISTLRAEQQVGELLQQADILRNPKVAVQVLERRHQNYLMLGAFVRPGAYQLPRPDFRLIDAISLAGDIQPGIDTIYVIRAYDPSETAASQPAMTPETAAPVVATPDALAEVAAAAGEVVPAASPASAAAGAEVAAEASPAAPSEAEMMAVIPSSTAPAAQVETAQPRKLIAVGDQWVEVPAVAESAPAAAPSAPSEASMPVAPGQADTQTSTTSTTDWMEAISQAGRQRILRIPVRELLHGDPRFNVVIRSDDRVYAWLGPVGEFYVGGNVYRPGVFSLTGRKMTVRQAIIAAGGLSPLAWPDRCELIRRYNDNQEEIVQLNLDAIFAGTQPDVVLKPNDVLNVGTNAIAPFMATVRNAFRLTYGFGFVYDRNFADIDSYSAQSNPADVRRSERATLFGSLFQ